MNKLFRKMVFVGIIISLLLPAVSAFASPVKVTLPTFPVTINGTRIDNIARQYPLIIYNDITYFPMTYYDARFLGLETVYSPQNGLEIINTGVVGTYFDYATSVNNPQSATAQIAALPVRVNGNTIDNQTEEYPLLFYRNITYFPLTWRFAVEEFCWDYYFNATSGLVINSYSAESIAEFLSGLYGEQMPEIVRESTTKLHNGNWLHATFREYSRHYNFITGYLSEYRPDDLKLYLNVEPHFADPMEFIENPRITEQFLQRDGVLYTSADGKNWSIISVTDFTFPGISHVTAALEQMPDGVYESVGWDFDAGYHRLYLSYIDDEPSSLPIIRDDGSIVGGGVNRHTFFFDLQECCLRSYWVSTIPLIPGEDGELIFVATPTTYFSIIDLEYQPIYIPIP